MAATSDGIGFVDWQHAIDQGEKMDASQATLPADEGAGTPAASSTEPAETSSPPASSTAAAPPPAEASDVEFNTACLHTGRNLGFPIFDKGGVLLVAQGKVVTSRFKELLALRGMNKVMVSRTDAVAMSQVQNHAATQSAAMELDSDVVKKLDDMIESGELFLEDSVKNSETRLQSRSSERYDQTQRDQLVVQHTETCSLLDDMIKASAHGETLNGGDISTVVSDYLSHLTLDSDCVHEVMSHARDFATLAPSKACRWRSWGWPWRSRWGGTKHAVRLVGMCGLLYNWGMVYVPREIREARHVLNSVEFLEIEKHPIYTANMLQRSVGNSAAGRLDLLSGS